MAEVSQVLAIKFLVKGFLVTRYLSKDWKSNVRRL